MRACLREMQVVAVRASSPASGNALSVTPQVRRCCARHAALQLVPQHARPARQFVAGLLTDIHAGKVRVGLLAAALIVLR